MFLIVFSRFVLLSNRTLQIRSPTEADLGNYKCQIRTGIDEVVLIARLSMRPNEEWILILIIIIICVLILLILIMCIICVRKRARRKGRYGVKDVSDGKHKNRWVKKLAWKKSEMTQNWPKKSINEFKTIFSQYFTQYVVLKL